MRTRIVASAAELAALEPAWWELWRRCPAATPFQSPAWLIPWWRHFAPGALFTVAVEEGGTLVALAPCYIEDGAYGRRVLPLGIGISDYLDVLLDPPHEAAAGRALAACVVSHAERWDSWELEELAPDAQGLRIPLPTRGDEQHSLQSACPVLLLPAADPLAAVPPNRLRKLRHAHNRLSRRSHELVRVAAPDTDAFLPELFRLHEARWHSRGEEGVFSAGVVQEFQREATRRLAQAGLLRLYGLRIEGELAGAYYGLHHRERAYYYIGGFDPRFAFESPGMVLIGHAIAEAGREGAREFHFLRGQEDYKYQWGAVDRWNARRSIRCRVPAGADA